MADDPIRAPRPSPIDDGYLTEVMKQTVNAVISMLPPGAVVTVLTSFPENTPGVVQKVPGGRTNYISNGERDEMANAMLEILKRWGKI